MSGLGWIHFSNTTRRRVLKVIDLLGEKGTIDELGIGVIRNAFSNELFNGISTIMTRARYYYTVPYLMIDYLRTSPKVPISRFMDDAESDIMEGLTRVYANPEKERIIGHTIAQKNIIVNKRVQELVRKPSEVYWGGIRTFGMFKKAHSFVQISEAINQGKYISKLKDNKGTKEESGDDDSGHEKWLDLFDVPYVSTWDKEQIELSPEEAEHFKQRISETMPGSFLSTLLSSEKYMKEFLNLKNFYEIPETNFFTKLNPYNAKVINTAIQFWNLLYGAHIRFNVLLQNRSIQYNPVSYVDVWEDWLNNSVSVFNWDEFDKSFLWEIVDKHSRVNWQTRFFINHWIDGLKNSASVDSLDKLVADQEKQNKRDRSKLIPNHLENYSEWVGISRLEYRLQNVQIIVQDILKPLTHSKDA